MYDRRPPAPSEVSVPTYLTTTPLFSYAEASSSDQLMEMLPSLYTGEPVVVVNTALGTIRDFKQRVHGAKGLVTDFDGTLHVGNQWTLMRESMLPRDRDADLASLRQYFSQEMHTRREMEQFIFGSVDRLVGRLTHDGLVRLSSQLPARPGCREFLETFGGDVGVVSFGINDFIHAWLGWILLSAHVSALRLTWSDGVATGYQPTTVVTDHNKGEMADMFRKIHNLAREEVMTIGDAPTDIHMMSPEGVGVLIVPKVDPDPTRMAYRLRGLPDLWPRVRAVLVADTLTPLAALRRNPEAGRSL